MINWEIAKSLDNQETARQFRELVRKTVQGKPAEEDLQALRKMLTEHPGLWRFAGDLARGSATRTIESLGGPALMQEALAAGVAEMRDGLGYATATALERALIEQVALAWLSMNVFEYHLAGTLKGEYTMKQLAFWHERAGTAQRRYLQACEALARVRKLAARTPEMLQINIGERQVNLAKVGDG
jgi:hypothetical protein